VTGRFARMRTALLLVALMACPGLAAAQQRPLDTQDPESIGAGNVSVAAGLTYANDVSYPLSGLEGNLWQVAVVHLQVGVSSIAEFEITGGPYDQLSIASRTSAPLASAVTTTGPTTHAVDDVVVGTKIRLISETADRPSVGFRFSVRLPNAKHESGLGQDTTDFAASLLGAKTVSRLRVVGNAGVMIMSEPLDAEKQNDVLTYGLALILRAGETTDLVAEANGRASARPGIAPIGTESRGVARAGFRHRIGGLQLDAAALFGLTRLDPATGVTFGFSYTFKAFAVP